MDRFDQTSATSVLTDWILRPGGAATAIGAFRDVPGLRFDEAVAGGRFRKPRPAILQAGDWQFVAPTEGVAELDLVHCVRGVVLQTTRASAPDAARQLAAAVLDAAARFGSDADIAVQSALYGLAAIG